MIGRHSEEERKGHDTQRKLRRKIVGRRGY
jgi:hypothetical protein